MENFTYRDILIKNIDLILTQPLNKRRELTGELIGIILEPLRKRNVSVEILEHLLIEFQKFQSPVQQEIDERLDIVRTNIREQFGDDILGRLRLRLSNETVNIFMGR